MKKFKKFMNNVKDKGKGLSCKTADTVIDEYRPADIENNTSNIHKKSCLIMQNKNYVVEMLIFDSFTYFLIVKLKILKL